jgi:hypothetical protein
MNGLFFIILYKGTVTDDICAEDANKLSLEFVLWHVLPPWAEGLQIQGRQNPKRGRAGKVRSEPLNETGVRFRSGGSGEIYNSGEIYLSPGQKIK